MTDDVLPPMPSDVAASRYDDLLNDRRPFDPSETPSPWWWKAALVVVLAGAFWVGVVL